MEVWVDVAILFSRGIPYLWLENANHFWNLLASVWLS